MRLPTVITGHFSPEGRRSLGYLSLLAFATTLILVLTQTIPWTPLGPNTWQPDTTQSSYVWMSAIYGYPAPSIEGASTHNRSTLELNEVGSMSFAEASWSIPFEDASELSDRALVYTLYLPGELYFASANSSLDLLVDGENFRYTPNATSEVTWHEGTLYVPSPQDLRQVPWNFRTTLGYGWYLPFNFTATSVPSSISVSLTVPSNGEIFLPNLAFAANGNYSAPVPATARLMGLLMLPAFAAGAVLVFEVVRRLGGSRYGGLLAIGVGVRLGLAPIFMHPDLAVLSRYPRLFYNYQFLDYQSFGYGPAWLAELLAAPAPIYALGAQPTVATLDVLIKLPNFAADVITFLLLVQLLSHFRTESVAVRWAAAGWLFNPIVIYFSAMHGLAESLVAMGLVALVLGIVRCREAQAAAGATVAVLAVPAVVIVYPLLFLAKRIRWRTKLLAFAIPVSIYVAVPLLLYRNFGVLVTLLDSYTVRTGTTQISLGASPFSAMTPLLVVYRDTGLYLTPYEALAALSLVALGGLVLGKRWNSRHAAVVLYASILSVYLTYEAFYIQHLVWVLPLLLVLLLLASVAWEKGLAYLAAFSVLALAVNALSYWSPSFSPYLAVALFVLLIAPVATVLSAENPLRGVWHRFLRVLPVLGTTVATVLVLLLVAQGPFRPGTLDVGVATLAAQLAHLWVLRRKEGRISTLLLPVLRLSIWTLPMALVYELSAEGASAIVLVTSLLLALLSAAWGLHAAIRFLEGRSAEGATTTGAQRLVMLGPVLPGVPP